MKQLSFKLDKPRKEHGGSLALNKRRSRRPLDMKASHHVTLKSNLATQNRCLLFHKSLIKKVLYRSANRFHIKIYQYAVAGNHLHLLVKSRSRISLQNFFRVFAGHTAQEILRLCPLAKSSDGAQSKSSTSSKSKAILCESGKTPCLKNQRKFWGYLIYSRVLSWGREFRTVAHYIIRNSLEALNIIAYRDRDSKTKFSSA